MGANAGGKGTTGLHPAGEDQVGELQSPRGLDPTEYRSRQEAEGMPRIHCGSRDGSPARTHAQRTLHGVDGSVHAEVAISPRRPQQTAGAARELGLLTSHSWQALSIFEVCGADLVI